MSSETGLLVVLSGIGLLLLVVLVAVVADVIASWGRPKRIRDEATSIGGEVVTLFPGAGACDSAFSGETDIMGVKDSGRIHNVMQFSPQRYLFDYEWLDRKGGKSFVQTVAAFGFRVPFSSFHLRARKDFIRRLTSANVIGRFLAAENLKPVTVRFEPSGDFSEKYVVTTAAAHEVAMRTLFAPDVLNFFERLDDRARWCLDADSQWLFIRSAGTLFGGRGPLRRRFLVDAASLQDFLQQASAIAQQFDRA